MPLLITPEDIETLHLAEQVAMPQYIEAVEAAYREQGMGTAQLLPRVNLWAEYTPGVYKKRSLKVAAALLRERGVMGTVAYSAGYSPGSLELWVQLFSATTGELLAILNGSRLSLWKTGATGAVAAKHLAVPEARRVGMIGTGRYAETQLTGLATLYNLEEVQLYSRTAQSREAFAERARAFVPEVKFVTVGTAQEAVERADIVVTVTSSSEPALRGEWLHEGVHVNAMGAHYPNARELDTEAVVRSRVIADDIQQAFEEKGEILIPLGEGTIAREHVLGSLGSVVSGNLKGRTSARDITLFCSGGTALEYVGVCALLYDLARCHGVGRFI